MSESANGPVQIDTLPCEAWSQGVRFGGAVTVLSDTRAGARRIGIAIEVLPPGKQSCPFHYHLVEEEHVIALEGRATLRLGDKTFPIAAGDYVCFPAGQRAGHCLINDSGAPFKFLIVGDRAPHDTCVYPDSGKIMISNFDRRIVRDEASLDYWQGERADQPL